VTPADETGEVLMKSPKKPTEQMLNVIFWILLIAGIAWSIPWVYWGILGALSDSGWIEAP
jgi:hypothetical protein